MPKKKFLDEPASEARGRNTETPINKRLRGCSGGVFARKIRRVSGGTPPLIDIYELRKESWLRNPCAAVRAFLNRNHDDPEQPSLHGERFSTDGAAPDLLHRGFRDLQSRENKKDRERDAPRESLHREDRGEHQREHEGRYRPEDRIELRLLIGLRFHPGNRVHPLLREVPKDEPEDQHPAPDNPESIAALHSPGS